MNVLEYAAVAEQNWKMNLGDMTSYKPDFSFYKDLSIAEFCEIYMRDRNAVKKTYNQVMKSWGSNYKALTEFILALNHKSWAFAQRVDSRYMGIGDEKAKEYAHLYNELWAKADNEFCRKFRKNDDAMSYYFDVTD